MTAPCFFLAHTLSASPHVLFIFFNLASRALFSPVQREHAATVRTMELALPARPVPRRKRPFIVPNQIAPPPPPAPPTEVVLDGFVLLEACRCEDPDEAEKAVLEGCGITSVISEDLSFFRKLSHLDLGDNRVPLASLAYLPAPPRAAPRLQRAHRARRPSGRLPALEVLNLSYNGLTSAAVAALADIPRLRQLDISQNELSALPADMSNLQRCNRSTASTTSSAASRHGSHWARCRAYALSPSPTIKSSSSRLRPRRRRSAS